MYYGALAVNTPGSSIELLGGYAPDRCWGPGNGIGLPVLNLLEMNYGLKMIGLRKEIDQRYTADAVCC